ncbi:carbonic anhydrase [Leptospira ognonensis]|uniref:Carbonic anhydrase n=1 Tax=Leptospira ognonensis TaxID=2484945 RepID=A0A4R9KAZ1_9LEPT|nr:SulP family inorganic anion transporter [Leptospira ognonensis]TGL61974.1 carbonic anhydrase [Leptospira ognonensis]
MLNSLKRDFPSSIVVFLVALPLCLGVALASGAPLMSGIISGVIGGILVGFLSQSHVSVSGPATGLVVIVFSGITNLGSFEAFLLSVIIAGFIQIIAGIFRAGIIANYIPSNVIRGLLAAIGIILILKQIPHAVGFDIDPEEDFSFFQRDGENTFSELIRSFKYFSWGAVIISSVSLMLLVFFDRVISKHFRWMPSSLIVVLIAILLNKLFENNFTYLYLSEKHLVNIPPIHSIGSLFTFPDISQISNLDVWFVGLSLALIASIETLINLDATENMDPHKRSPSPNIELMAQGIGNITSGFLGGLPITSVIVRSSVNITSGAETKLSTIIHGVLLAISVIAFSPFLNLIPLSSLAAILLLTGYKLARISVFREIYSKGSNQFLPFLFTVIAIVFTDLLIGVMFGLAVSIFFLLKNNYKNPFLLERDTHNIGETVRLELPNQVSFLNRASIKDSLWALPIGSKVIIDATNCNFIDSDILEIIHEFKSIVAIERKIQLNLIGIRDQYELSDQIQFVNILDKEAQQKITPDEILEILKKGNERFTKGKWTEKYFKHQVNATAFGQNPFAVVLSCIDSRTSPEIIFDTGLGDVISIRIAGNIVNEEILGSLELSCDKIGTKLIVVLGHSNCGAISSAINSVNEGNIFTITRKIQKAIDQCAHMADPYEDEDHVFNHVVKANVHNSIAEILNESKYIAKRIRSNEIKMVAAFYDTKSGIVTFEDKGMINV